MQKNRYTLGAKFWESLIPCTVSKYLSKVIQASESEPQGCCHAQHPFVCQNRRVAGDKARDPGLCLVAGVITHREGADAQGGLLLGPEASEAEQEQGGKRPRLSLDPSLWVGLAGRGSNRTQLDRASGFSWCFRLIPTSKNGKNGTK